MQQSSSEDGVLPYSQEASVLSFPPTPPCQPQLPVSYPGNQQVPEPTESPSQVSSSLGQRLQRFGSNLQIRHVNKQQLQQVLFLGAISYAVYFVHPVFINQVLSFSTGCSRGLVGHLRSLGMLGHASSLCQKGYNRLSDLVYISEHQLHQEIGIQSSAHRHRLLYTSGKILAREQMRMAAQESYWGPLSVLFVFAAMLCMLCFVAAVVAVLTVAPLRQKLTVLLAVVSSEVWYFYHNKAKQVATSDTTGGMYVIPPTSPAGLASQPPASPSTPSPVENSASTGSQGQVFNVETLPHTQTQPQTTSRVLNGLSGSLKGLRLRRKRTSGSESSRIPAETTPVQPVAEDCSNSSVQSFTSPGNGRKSSGQSWIRKYTAGRLPSIGTRSAPSPNDDIRRDAQYMEYSTRGGHSDWRQEPCSVPEIRSHDSDVIHPSNAAVHEEGSSTDKHEHSLREWHNAHIVSA